MTLLERVARAIKAEVPFGYGMTDAEAAQYARAAIAAMREPTEAMADAGFNADTTTVSDIWRAMIEAALEEVA